MRRGAKTLLLVEEEEDVRGSPATLLVESGYTVLEAATTEEAVRICAEHESPISLLLSDVVMPTVIPLVVDLWTTHPKPRARADGSAPSCHVLVTRRRHVGDASRPSARPGTLEAGDFSRESGTSGEGAWHWSCSLVSAQQSTATEGGTNGQPR